MEKTEKILSARERQALQKRDQIITASMELFWKTCIEDTSMEEIAKRAKVGVATVYRYFSTKIELVVETAQCYWKKVAQKYLGELNEVTEQSDAETDMETGEEYLVSATKSGADQLQKIMEIFCDIFAEQKAFLKFLQEFDVFVKKYQISGDGLANYETGILNLKPYMTNALEAGQRDGSLVFHCSVDEMYFSLTHAMLALMEKLSVAGDILLSDQIVAGDQQIRVISQLLLDGMKKG